MTFSKPRDGEKSPRKRQRNGGRFRERCQKQLPGRHDNGTVTSTGLRWHAKKKKKKQSWISNNYKQGKYKQSDSSYLSSSLMHLRFFVCFVLFFLAFSLIVYSKTLLIRLCSCLCKASRSTTLILQ